jgi:glycosyltransferase involved in cell wall biosynthesis
MASHNEVLRSYVVALLAVNCKLVCCTTTNNYKQLYDLQDDPRIDWLLKNKAENDEQYFKRIHQPIRTCDASIVTTTGKDLSFYSQLKFPTKSFLVVHHYHALLEPLKHFSLEAQSVKHYLKILRYFLRNQRRKVDSLISNYDGLILPSPTVREYVKTKPVYQKHYFVVADFCVHEFEPKCVSTGTVTAVVPGSINRMTRDYDLLVRVMQRVTQRLKKSFTLTLLGEPQGEYGHAILKKLSELNNQYFTLRSYQTSFIHQKEYDAQMKEADFLILPINLHMKHDLFKEVSSQSAVSGNIGDMVRFGLPAILPAHYKLHSDLEQLVGRYEDEIDFCRLLSDWIEIAVYDSKKKSADKALRSFSPTKIGQTILSEIS